MKILSTKKYIDLITRIKDLEHEIEILKFKPQPEPLTDEQIEKKKRLEKQLEVLSSYNVQIATGRGEDNGK